MTPEETEALVRRGRRIRDRRVSLGMRRKELAKKIDKSYDYLAGIENGHKRGAPETLVAIARALGMRVTIDAPIDWTDAA
jgi:transcriptional regulator with XRE-family HTH domain